MADASHSDLIAQFSNISGVDADRAKFYLESAAWNLDVAIASFYEDDDGPDDVAGEPVPVDSPSRGQPAAAPQAKSSSRFATLSDMHDDAGSSEEEGQAFYAGGSERSGQQVLGPPRKKQSADDFVKNMFESAREHGAETVDESGPSKPPARSSAFRGTGYRLGDTDEGGSEAVRGLPMHSSGPKQVDVVLKLWKKGFSVDSGPLRDYHDPANKEFLSSIHKGEVPSELKRLAKGDVVNVNMEDHRNEDFVQPKVTVKAFTGAGNILGSPAPSLPTAAASSAASAAAAPPTVDIDASKPTTNVQIRLADGTRMVAKFNHTHTVGDIRQYIINAHPQFATSTFALMTTFPNKELTEESATLEDAKLLNAVLVQRMK